MRILRSLAATVGMLAILTGTASAQKNWTGQFNLGGAISMGAMDSVLTGAFSWGFGARYSPADAPWGLRIDIRTTRFNGRNENIQPLLDKFGASDAYARTWDFTLQGDIGTSTANKFRAYVIGGGGYYNRYAALTEPTLVGGCYWDPWWGYICGSGTADQILVSKSDWAWGLNGGAGVSLKTGRGASVFVEGVYNIMYTKNSNENTGTTGTGNNTTWMPIYIGVRF